MSQIVAINGDCLAIPGPGFSAGPITYTDVSKISVGGTKVIKSATCTFTMVAFPMITDVVTLSPGTTKLTDNSDDVLKVGDVKVSGSGNILAVKPTITNKLKSS